MEYEKAAKKLQDIVDKMSGDVTLAESIKLFEQGVAESRVCMDILSEAKGKITAIRKEMDGIFEEPIRGDA